MTSRDDAVEHIDPFFDAFEDILRGAHAHKIPRFLFGKVRDRLVNHLVHLDFTFSYAEPAQGIPREIQRDNLAGALLAQIRVDAPLDNSNRGNLFPNRMDSAKLQPLMTPNIGPL